MTLPGKLQAKEAQLENLERQGTTAVPKLVLETYSQQLYESAITKSKLAFRSDAQSICTLIIKQ